MFDRAFVLNTFRYLRLATLAVALMLAAAVLYQRAQSPCWQTSISAYYFSSAHSVFVAALCAVGTCLIVYHGNSDTEDVILNYSGFLFIIVALVPTDRELVCGPTGLPAAYDVAPGVRNNVVAVLVAGVAAEIARIWLTRNTGQPRPSTWARRVTLLGWVVIGVGVATFIAAPLTFQNYGHTTSAVLAFVGVIAVILMNAWSARAADQPPGYERSYRVIAAVMAAAIVAIAVIRFAVPAWRHIVLAVEVVLIGAFAAFWAVQTKELWDVADRRELLPSGPDRQHQP